MGESLLRWTIRLAVACYLARVLIDLRGGRRPRLTRWLWTIGCGLYLAHVACAFHFVHHWSHRAAYEHTARQTAALTGLNWGGGLYVNDLFTLIWMLDVVAWWRWENWPQRRSVYWTTQLVFAFLMLNATVVFGPPFWKWIAAGFMLTAVAAFRWRLSSHSDL